MYFSNNNEKVTYSYIYGHPLEVEVEGGGKVCKEDTILWGNPPKNWSKEHSQIELTDGITEVGEGFLDVFTNMKRLIIHQSVTSIGVTEFLQKQMLKKKVVVCGWAGTYAEQFAKENGLKFMQADIVVGWYNDEAHGTNTKMTLSFTNIGRPYLTFDDFTSGISAGNCGGGTYTRDLDSSFPKGVDCQKFAEMYPRFREPILKNKDLEMYFKSANKQ